MIVIEGFQIIEPIAEGFHASVFKAKQILLDRIVAIKVLGPSDARSIQRFQNEVRVTSSLEHPNLVKVLGSGVLSDSRPYLIMEYLDGRTLAQELEAVGKVEINHFREIFIPLLSALDAAHKAGLVAS